MLNLVPATLKRFSSPRHVNCRVLSTWFDRRKVFITLSARSVYNTSAVTHSLSVCDS